jgi:hypothetical protein
MKKLGQILGTIALACIAMAAFTFAILFVAAWSIGGAVISAFALFMFYGEGTPSNLALGSVPAFGPRMVCTSCGIVGADARPNWKEEPPRESLTGVRWRS